MLKIYHYNAIMCQNKNANIRFNSFRLPNGYRRLQIGANNSNSAMKT